MSTSTSVSNPFESQTKQSEDTANRYQETADKLRGRASAWGGAIQTIGLAAVAWIGLDTVVDVFPVSTFWGGVLSALVVVAVSTMAVSALVIGRQLTKQNRPLAMSINLGKMPDLDPAEKANVQGIYKEFAELNGYVFRSEAGQAVMVENGKTTYCPNLGLSRR